MSNNLDNDRSISTGKMYPIDLAPQKITIVKSVSNTEMKMTHLISNQPKTSVSNQLMGHAGTGTGLMRPGLAQIISPSVASQPQMIVSGSPILQGTQIVSQSSQLLSQNSQIISQSQLITPSGQIISPATQIISQGTQLSAPVSSSNNTVNLQGNVSAPVSGAQVLSVGGQFGSGAGNLLVNSSVRTLPPTVRVLPPLSHHNNRPVQLSGVNFNSAGGVLVSKSVGVGVTSHVPRGLAAGASLAVRPVTPSVNQPLSTQGSWSTSNRGSRGALVYGSRGVSRSGPTVSTPSVTQLTPTPVLTLPTTSVLNSSGVISTTVRGVAPRTPTPTPAPAAPRPLPLLQRNSQPAKVVGVANVGVRGVVGNSAPTQLYYEVPRPALPTVQIPSPLPAHPTHQTHPTHPSHAHSHSAVTNPVSSIGNGGALAHALAPQVHRQLPYVQTHAHSSTPTQLNIVNASTALPETRPSPVSISNPVLPRASILRKRDIDGSPTKTPSTGLAATLGMSVVSSSLSLTPALNTNIGGAVFVVGEGMGATGWEDVPAGGEGGSGSTTVSASSSPTPDAEPDPPPQPEVSPRKKPRKQNVTNERNQLEYRNENPSPSPPPVNIKAPKRPLLSSSYSCGWRSTALHFIRPSDVKVREPRARDILAIASQKHVLTSAEGWKVHHLTAQMDDLVSLESDVGEQLSKLLRSLDNAPARILHSLQPQEHAILELLKGNVQRSKIVCESVQEAREDILRVFTHRKFVSDILTRQADKRCFRKHRSQS